MLNPTKSAVFVFTNKVDGRILLAKKTAEMNLHFTTDEIGCFQIEAGNIINQKTAYSLEEGFFSLPDLETKEAIQNFELLKKKVEFLLVFKINTMLIDRGIEARLNDGFSVSITENIEQRQKIDEFIKEEKTLLKKEGERFFAELIYKVGKAKNMEQVFELERYLKNNVNLGYFSLFSLSGG